MNYLQVVRTYPRYIGFGYLHSFFSSLGQTFLFALFVPHINETFHLSAATSGGYYGVITITSALLLLYSGSLIDTVNLRVYSSLVGIILGCGALLMGLAHQLWLILLGMFLLRHFGQGLMTVTSSTSIARFFTANRGKALSLRGMGVATGEALLPGLVAMGILAVGWQQTYLLLGVACFIVFLPLSRWLVNRHDPFQHPDSMTQETVPHLPTQEELNWDRRQLLTNNYFWLLLPLTIAPAFFITGLFYHQAALVAYQGWTMALIASCFVACGIGRVTGSIMAGPLVDRFGATRVLPITLLPFMLGVATLLAGNSTLHAVVYLGLTGLGVGFGENAKGAMWAEVYGRRHLGAIKSLVGMVAVGSTAISPPLGGWLLDRGMSVGSLLWAIVILCALASTLAVLAKPPHIKR